MLGEEPGLGLPNQHTKACPRFQAMHCWCPPATGPNQPLAPNELQAGIEALEPQNNFWGVNLADDLDAKKDMETLMSLLSRPSTSVI